MAKNYVIKDGEIARTKPFCPRCGDGVFMARMLVPKMVKNGFNSVLQPSAGSRRLVAQGIQEQIRRLKTALKSKNKNKKPF